MRAATCPTAAQSRVYARTSTPADAGLASWSAQQIADAIRTGKDDQMMPLSGTMPYAIYSNLTPDDGLSIAMYLKSLAPQEHVVPEHRHHRRRQRARRRHGRRAQHTLPTTDPAYASAERGRYLATVVCLDCHTPRDGGTPPQNLAMAFAGGRPSGQIKSANLTPDSTGLGSWTADEISATVKTGLEKGDAGHLCPSMPTYNNLSAGDPTDLGGYLHTLPPIVNGLFHDGGC